MENLYIRPSKDLRNNYAEMSKLCREEETPIAATVNGHQDTVLISHEQFIAQQTEIKELKAQLELYKHLAQSRDDIRLGRTYDIDEVFDELTAKLEALR